MAPIVDEQGAASEFRDALAGLLPELRAFARFLAGNRAEADDLVQDTVLRGLTSASQFVPGSSLRAWSFTILRNTYYEQYRRRRREAAHQNLPSGEAGMVGPAQEASADLGDLVRALAGLPPMLREALILVGAQGMAYEEAAEVCNVPVGTMKARVSRARQALAKRFEHADAGPSLAPP